MENCNNSSIVPQSDLTEKNTPKEYSEINICSPQGRIGRVRYLVYSSGLLFLSILFYGMGVFTGGLTWIIILLFFVPWQFFIIIQRIHDINESGWWLLLIFFPYLNVLFLLSLLIIPGSNGSNEFGRKAPPNTKRERAAFFPSLLFILFINLYMMGK